MSEPIITAAVLAKMRSLPMLKDDDLPRSEFLLWENPRTRLSCYYAPFEYLNRNAKLILVGITPGGTQMNRALNAARTALASGTSIETAVRHWLGTSSGKEASAVPCVQTS